MAIEVTYSNNTFTISEIEPTADELYRVRLFLAYSGKLSYVGTEGVGLTVNQSGRLLDGVLYDDWNCSFRPPRIDAHEFNCEIVVPLATGRNEIELVGDGDIGGESIIDGSLVNPANILIETADQSDLFTVTLIKVDGNRITVTTDTEHSFKKGDSITVSNDEYSSKHLLGPDGLRILGTFKIVSVTPTTFTYVTNHYIMPSDTVFISSDGWSCGKWSAYVYEDEAVSCEVTDSEIILALVRGFEKGDTLYMQSIPFKVVNATTTSTFVKYEGYDDIDLPPNETVVFSPRTPSAAVPVNWSMHGLIRVSDESPYDHTMNTYFVSPYLDTYFTKDDDMIHVGEDTLKCAGGDTPSIICIKFPNITMEVDYGQSAKLRMYVNRMSYSEASVSLYQMNSNGWREDMSYDEVLTHVTQIPVAAASLTNPALKDDNKGENTPVLGNYNSYVDFDIDSVVLGQWLSGNTAYSPSVCMKIISGGDPVIEFNSTESGEMVPYFIVTGGEEAVLGQEPFDIIVENPATEPGKIIRVEVDDPDATFGNSLYDNVVKINGVTASIMNGSPYYIDVVVPENVAGVSQVQVYKKVRNKEVVLTNPTTVYVNNDLTKRDVKLAAKKNPGEITGKTSRSALYNRDLGYSNFKEVTDETSLLQNVYSCLLTSHGERLFNQNFGTHIEDRIFTLGDTTGETDLLKECIEVVEKYEPRVKIDPERSSCNFDESGCYNLVLAVVLPTARTELLKFTFKNRGRIV